MSENSLISPYPLDLEMASGRLKDAANPSIYFDGVFKGDYSLAVVNRCLAEALIKTGVELACFAHDTDWQADPLLMESPSVRARMRSAPPVSGSFDVHIRNTWPPNTKNMIGRTNAYACFAWEESEFPANLVDRFNRDLDLVMVASTFVKRALVDSGVTIPVEIVGEGADHVVKLAMPARQNLGSRPRFLHVSSGFIRKGVDCLIKAYRQAFVAGDDVELVVKTFPNPNNLIPKLIAGLDGPNDCPAIRIIETSYSHAELLGLYRTATAIVAPSRGEGFGLPLAEAMALDVPVITTNYSGQVDFCRPDTSWLVDYTLSASKAHVSSSFSLWAEPDVAHLGEQMKAVLTNADEVARRSAQAKAFVQNHLTWTKTARRTLYALSKHRLRNSRLEIDSLASNRAITIDVVSSWERNCGIATYASHLYQGTVLSRHVSAILAQTHGVEPLSEPPKEARVSRLWGDNHQSMLALADRLEHGAADALWIQHHPGHFSAADMQALTQGLRKSKYRTRVITFHSVTEAARGGSLAWCSAFDTAFVHSTEDAEALSKLGHRNPVVVPHGFLPISPPLDEATQKSCFDIGSFGFLTPHKNIDMLVRSFAVARRFTGTLRLHLFNCVLPDDKSNAARAVIENLVHHHGLNDVVFRHYDFISEQQLIPQLSQCDLFVFPYGQTTETATGAARMALSANRPILCSQSAVLRDLHPVSHVLKELSVEGLAEALLSLSQSNELLSFYDHQRSEFVRRHSYGRAATRYLGQIMRALDGNDEHRRAA